jgi:glycosyltransferase involved in cell wall biosynthesis
MRISIVTLSYNQSEFLEQAICSVISQDYSDIEYIVVDPGSSDGSRSIIERYADRIDKIIFDPDEGPADGLNKGFEKATGDIFGFINADDALLPGALKNVALKMIDNPKIDVVCGHIYKVDQDLKVIRRLQATHYTPYRYVYGGVQVTQQGTFFRKRAYKNAGGFNTGNKTSWDAELLLDIWLSEGEFHIMNKYLAVFRVHDDSISGSGRLASEYASDLSRLFRKVVKRTPKKGDWVVSNCYKILKWGYDPIGLLYRIYDAVVRPYLRPEIIMLSD